MTTRCVMACIAIVTISSTSACTGSTATHSSSLPPTVPATDLRGASDVAGTQLLYVSDEPPPGSSARGFVNIYQRRGPASALRLIGTISGLDSPTQIAVDRSANVYVVQTDNGAPVLVFKRGATQPFLKLDTTGKLAIAITVANDGTVYVGTGGGLILVYVAGSSTPISTLQAYGDGPNQLFLDRDGNLYFAAVVFGEIGGIIAMFPHGSTTPGASLGFPDSPLRAALLKDGDMAIEPLSVDRIDRFERGQTTLAGTFPIAFAQTFCLNQAESALYGAGAGKITTYAFPSGRLLNTMSIGGVNDENFGCASWPTGPAPRPF